MLNSELMQRESANFVKYLNEHAPGDRSEQVRLAFRRVLQREPTPAEVARGVKLIEELQQQDGLSSEQAIQNFCLLALNLNEFIYLD